MVLAACAATFAVGCVSSHPPNPAQTAVARPPPAERHIYRLDFVVASTDSGKAAQSSAYTLNLQEFTPASVHIGSNVALVTSGGGASPRQDVGLKIGAFITPTGDDLLLHGTLEMSGVDDVSTIHKITANGDAVLLKGGQPALLASLEDPISHKRYQVTAAATKLR
jgi:hypothetical protein